MGGGGLITNPERQRGDYWRGGLNRAFTVCNRTQNRRKNLPLLMFV